MVSSGQNFSGDFDIAPGPSEEGRGGEERGGDGGFLREGGEGKRRGEGGKDDMREGVGKEGRERWKWRYGFGLPNICDKFAHMIMQCVC